MRRINDVVIVLRQASRNMVDTWRELTFAGIVRIQFPVAATASPETAVKYATRSNGNCWIEALYLSNPLNSRLNSFLFTIALVWTEQLLG